MVLIRNNKGAAMPTVIMVMLVVFLLGMALLTVSSADVIHASRQYNKTQAHYLARSGAHVGLDIMKNELGDKDYSNLDDLVSDLSDEAVSLGSVDVGGLGNFNLSYERFSGNEVKIFSTGTRTSSPELSDLVTLRTRVTLPVSLETFPDLWYSGINLKKGITEDQSYLGSGVILEGNPTSSPMGSFGNSSFYQASMFYFTENIKKNSPEDSYISLRQVQNSVSLTFDGEIIYFVGKVTLNSNPYDSDPSANDQIYLSLSETAAEDKVTNEDSILYDGSFLTLLGTDAAVGFENWYYYDFVRGVHEFDKHSEYAFDEDTGYGFVPNTRYGIVYFGKNVYSGATPLLPTTVSNYYFYPSGINLKDPDIASKLIPILSDDGILTALRDKFRLTVSGPYLWGNE